MSYTLTDENILPLTTAKAAKLPLIFEIRTGHLSKSDFTGIDSRISENAYQAMEVLFRDPSLDPDEDFKPLQHYMTLLSELGSFSPLHEVVSTEQMAQLMERYLDTEKQRRNFLKTLIDYKILGLNTLDVTNIETATLNVSVLQRTIARLAADKQNTLDDTHPELTQIESLPVSETDVWGRTLSSPDKIARKYAITDSYSQEFWLEEQEPLQIAEMDGTRDTTFQELVQRKIHMLRLSSSIFKQIATLTHDSPILTTNAHATYCAILGSLRTAAQRYLLTLLLLYGEIPPTSEWPFKSSSSSRRNRYTKDAAITALESMGLLTAQPNGSRTLNENIDRYTLSKYRNLQSCLPLETLLLLFLFHKLTKAGNAPVCISPRGQHEAQGKTISGIQLVKFHTHLCKMFNELAHVPNLQDPDLEMTSANIRIPQARPATSSSYKQYRNYLTRRITDLHRRNLISFVHSGGKNHKNSIAIDVNQMLSNLNPLDTFLFTGAWYLDSLTKEPEAIDNL